LYGNYKNTSKTPVLQDTTIHDLENDVPGVVPTVSHHVSLTNGYLGGENLGRVQNSAKITANTNGVVANGRPSLRSMLASADNYTMDGQL
jgi:hypothetical protein